MQRATLEQAHEMGRWAAAEGWQPGEGDMDAFHASDPDGFYVGYVDGELAAMASVVRYTGTYAFAGFYIVRADLRGQGVGHAIGDAIHTEAGLDQLVVGGDGVPAQVATYEGLGFVLAHWTDRWGGDPAGILDALVDVDTSTVTPLEFAGALRDQVHAYDTAHVPAARPLFVDAWYASGTPRRSFVALRDGQVTGLATVRPTLPDGARIGPLFADDASTAAALLAECARASAPWIAERGGLLHLDIPAPNEAARDLAQRCGMSPGFRCARMYRGGEVTLPVTRIYGNTTFELG